MSKHTKEPWVLNSDGRVEDTHGASIAQCYQHSISAGRAMECNHSANAARIVACVNACEGIEDPSVIPELLKLAEQLASRIEDQYQGEEEACRDFGHRKAIDRTRKLLARAEGR